MHKDTSHEVEISKVKVETTDTTSIKTITSGTVTINYGDTLSGNLSFTDEQVDQMEKSIPSVDSLESSGIKVKVSVVQSPDKKSFKTQITAISKPKSSTNTYTQTTTEKKGIDVKSTAETEKKKDVAVKDVHIKKIPTSVIIVCFLLFILLIIILLGRKAISTYIKNFKLPL